MSKICISEQESAFDAVERLTCFITFLDTIVIPKNEAKADLIRRGLKRLFGEQAPEVTVVDMTYAQFLDHELGME